MKKDIEIKHEKQINQYIAGSSESHWNMPTCVAKRWWEEREKKKKIRMGEGKWEGKDKGRESAHTLVITQQ